MKKIFKNVICLAIIISCLIGSYKLLRINYEKKLYDNNKIKMNLKIEPASVLAHALITKDWTNLSLSDNFKNKYKSKYDLIPDAKKYKVFDCGYCEIDGNYVIEISSDVPESIFDLYGEKTITTSFYFDYKIVDNKLDDVNLIETQKYKTVTCKPIEE